MWIDKSAFFNRLIINKQGSNYDMLQDYIDRYEQEYLDYFFGAENATIIEDDRDNPKYKYIVDILSGVNSPIACYVFYQFQTDNVMIATQKGDARIAVENATLSTNTYRMRLAWNEMVDKNIKMYNYIRKHKSDFNDFVKHRVPNGFFKKINDCDL